MSDHSSIDKEHVKGPAEADTKAENTAKEEELRIEVENETNEQTAKDIEDQELAELKEWLSDTDRNHIWVFNAGNHGQDFRGNPKFLFAYVNNYRHDIKALWICRTDEIIEQIRRLGFRAYHLESAAAGYAIGRVGVAVAEQVRGLMPFDDSVKYLNLWHGWGYKPVERARVDDDDDLRWSLCPKYIRFNTFYQNNQIVCVVNSLQEKYFFTQMGVTHENILRCGYARCIYQKKFKPIVTFNHDLLGVKDLSESTRIAVYAPTFRKNQGNTFADALPDLEALYEHCQRNNILLIFKMHPLMEDETAFLAARDSFGNRPYFMFWDNRNDIYEVIHKVDLLIYDYSSIFSDFLLAGVKNFIRYLFDGDDMEAAADMNDEQEYYNNTRGRICRTFEDLLSGIDAYEEKTEEEDLNHFLARQWEYADDGDLEKIIDATLDFRIKDKKYPVLYSYDIFGTLLSRVGLDPKSIFYAMRERMRADKRMDFDRAFIERFPLRRHHAEFGIREYMNKSLEQRHTIKREVVLDQIYREIQVLEELTDEQTEYLIKLECDTEIDSVIPLSEQIDRVKELLAAGEKVILISDMYLPKDVIQKMLYRADPVLAKLDLFLSNEYGVLKTDRELFFQVYKSIKPFYYYSKWIHTGDTAGADQNQPRRMFIETRLLKQPTFNGIESAMSKNIGSYDAFKVAALQAGMRSKYNFARSEFVIDYVAPLMVSYIDWAVRDAVKNGFETLYFVSRDGHPLKRIADALIKTNGWNIKTKYIYASRIVWRVPSYIDKVDDEFFASYGGNFLNIHTKENFLSAACFDTEEQFNALFPQIDLSTVDFNNWTNGQPARNLSNILKASSAYHKHLIDYGAKHRPIACEYLLQEVDPNEKYAFVEFFGRGYNQTCHSRMWNHALGREVPLHYYYARVLFPSEGNCVRHHMTSTNIQFFFLESIFANMPYKSITSYERCDGKIVPVKVPCEFDADLFNAMEQLLPEYACEYAKLSLENNKGTDKDLFDFLVQYFENNKTAPFIYDNFGSLVDAVSIYTEKEAYARPYTNKDIDSFMAGVPRGRGTKSITMSYMRSSPEVKNRYNEIYQLEPGNNVAGGTLLKTEAELAGSKRFKDRLNKEKVNAANFAKLYRTSCENTGIRSKATLITDTKSLNDSLLSIHECLKKQDVLIVQEFFDVKHMSDDDKQQLAEAMAQSRYVLLNGTIPFLSNLTLREGSSLILIDSSAFKIAKQGICASFKLKSEKKYKDFLFSIKANAYDSASDIIASEICERFAFDPHNTLMLKGSAITDIYKMEEYKKGAFGKLNKVFPESKNKKILLYIPSLRIREHSQRYFELLDIEVLQKHLGDEYVVVINTGNNQKMVELCPNTLEIEGFSKLINDKIRLRELMITADVIVGDYRDAMFESVLLERPAYFTGFDYEKKQTDVNIMRDFSRTQPFPIVRTAEELAQALKHIESYDFAPLHEFRDNYLTYCDGHVGERIVAYMLNGTE